MAIEEVSYTVHIGCKPGSSLDREWSVRRVRLREEISTPYEMSVDLISEISDDDAAIETEELLGLDVLVQLERGPMSRSIAGLVHQVSCIGARSNEILINLLVVPALFYLTQQVDTRVFQNRTAPEILKQVLGSSLGRYGRSIDVSRLHESYVTRDYCVQYGESDLDFVRRLMEEEGISYIFEPGEDRGRSPGMEVMVLCDQEPGSPNADFAAVEGLFVDEVSVAADGLVDVGEESVFALEWSRPERANKISIQRFNWKQPRAEHLPKAEKAADPRLDRVREVYLPEDRRRVVDREDNIDYAGTEIDEDEGEIVKRRFELMVEDLGRGNGSSNLIGLFAGGVLKVSHDADSALAGKRLLITRAVHIGDAPEVERSARTTIPRFENSFSCILADTPFRPPLKTPRPRIFGPQTAIVTGPAGEEIHTDKHGRIKVRFHWDRLSPHDDTSSCWVRVAQMWAGPGWGTWFVPRVGMEVVVEFLDGNPDRPLVTGCVYNGVNGTPYTLPDEKTKSTIKTNSSLGGGGSNELRFEDAKGSEEIYTHAQKDYNEVVENDHSTTVNANQTNTVKGNQTQSVGGNQAESVSGEQTMSVTKNRTVTIDGSQAVTIQGGQANAGVSGSKLSITGDYKVDVSNVIEVQAPTHIKLTVGGSSILIEPGKITIEAGGLAKVVFDANAEMTSSAGSKVKLDGDVLTVASHGAQVKLTTDAQVLAADGGELKLTADADLFGAKAIVSGSVAKLELTGDASLEGTNVSVSGEAKVGIAGGAVSSAASGSNEITGSVVKIN